MKLNNTTPYPKVMEVLRRYKHHYLWKKERSNWTEIDYENLNSGKDITEDWYNIESGKTTVSTSVIDTATGIIYPNAANAARTLGMDVSSLQKKISGIRPNNTTLRRIKK